MNGTNSFSATCGSCRFWTRAAAGKSTGVCRAIPPTLLLLGVGQHKLTGEPMPLTETFWPQVPESEWCGYWASGERRIIAVDFTQLNPEEAA